MRSPKIDQYISIQLVILLSLFLAGCQRGTEPTSRNSMNELSPRLQLMFEKTRSVCFGRFLINIPSTATIVYGPAEVEAPITYYQGESGKVDEHLSARLAEIEEERSYLLKEDIPNFPLFGKVIDGVVPGQKIVFGTKDRVGYAIHSFIPVGGDLFVQHLDSVLPEYDRGETLKRVASHLRSRSEDEIPAEAGSCIEGGFVPLEQEYERATIGIRLQEFPDVHISIDVHKNRDYLPEGSSPKLLREQAKQSAEDAGLGAVFARTRILRQQDRQLGIWKGEEIALRTPAYKDDKSVHEFRFHSQGALHDALHPELDIRLDSGVRGNSTASVNPSITDEEALALWDKLITTIRIRKPSDATSTTPAAPRVPLASVVRTGEMCPQTGWWETTEYEGNGGDARRLLSAGEPMPHVLRYDGFWKKLSRSKQREQSVAWKLVEYVDELLTSSTIGGSPIVELKGTAESPAIAAKLENDRI
jgi:hypothetical protein